MVQGPKPALSRLAVCLENTIFEYVLLIALAAEKQHYLALLVDAVRPTLLPSQTENKGCGKHEFFCQLNRVDKSARAYLLGPVFLFQVYWMERFIWRHAANILNIMAHIQKILCFVAEHRPIYSIYILGRQTEMNTNTQLLMFFVQQGKSAVHAVRKNVHRSDKVYLQHSF